MAKSFNKQTFKNSQKKILLACLCMMLIGIVSVICALTVGYGVGLDHLFNQWSVVDPDAKITVKLSDNFGKDPKDYYGTYYTENDYVIQKIEINEDGATVQISSLTETETHTYSVQYATKKYAYKKFGLDTPLLIVYQGTIDSYSLWHLKQEDGKYYLEIGEKTYTQEPITMPALLGDPADYLGTYYGTRDLGVESFAIGEDKVTVRFERIGQTAAEQVHSYCYVPAKFAKKYLDRENDAILLYTENLKTIDRILWLQKTQDGYSLKDDLDNTFTTEVISTEALLDDPKDYDGIYYSSSEYIISKFVLDNGTLTETIEQATKDTVTNTYEYQYLNQELAAFYFPSYEIDGSVLVLTKAGETEAARALFLDKQADGSYAFEDQNGNAYSTEEITFTGLVSDPKDYYGTYTFNAQNKLILQNDQSAEFTLDGVATTYSYFYADQGWLTLYTSKGSYTSAIVLYKDDMDGLYLFRIDEDGNMVYGDMYTFVK